MILVWLYLPDIGYQGFMTCIVACHQGVIKIFWLHFWRALILSITIYSQWRQEVPWLCHWK